MDMEREEGHFDDVSGHYVEGIFFIAFFLAFFLHFCFQGRRQHLSKALSIVICFFI